MTNCIPQFFIFLKAKLISTQKDNVTQKCKVSRSSSPSDRETELVLLTSANATEKKTITKI